MTHSVTGKTYVVASQGVIPNLIGGGLTTLLTRGAELPSNIDPVQLEVLLATGQVVEGVAVGGLAPVVTGDGAAVLTAPETEVLDDVDGPDGPIPPKSATKDVWVDFAVSKGADRAQAEDSTKDDLIAAYGEAT